MKVAILGTRGIPAEYGGFETFAENLSVGMVNNDHQVSVYCPHYQVYNESEYMGVKLQYVLSPEVFFKGRVMRAACTIMYDLFSLLKVSFSDVDVVYMLGYASGPFLIIPRLTGKILVINPDALEWKSTRWGWFSRRWLILCERMAAYFSHVLIADAPAIKEHFETLYGVDVECIPYGACVPPVVDNVVADFEPFSYYLVVARMVPETSVNVMIKGFKLSSTTRRLLIVGPIADKEFFEREVYPLIDGEKVVYLGSIYDRAMLTSLRLNAFALIQGHASEGTSPSLLESMACASPVIAINRKSNVDILGGGSGLFFDSSVELSACIKQLDDCSEEERMRLGEVNKQHIERYFTWGVTVDLHISVFKELLSNADVGSKGT